MRLLHVSDWHLGRLTGRLSRAPDHEAVFEETVALAREARPDLVLHTGDLFDAVRPGYEDMMRAIDALRRLGEVAPVMILCGNHDSPALFRVFAALHGADGRMTFVAAPRRPPYAYPAADGDVIRVAPMPFVHQNRAIQPFESAAAEWRAAYADRLREIWKALRTGLDAGRDPERHVAVLAAHLHLAGAVTSGSERRIHVKDDYASRAEHLPPAGYAAFGHIHRPQAIPGSAGGRYAGSPIPLDFGEEGERKSVVLVEARPGRRARVETLELAAGRPLRTIACALDGLAAAAEGARGALCRVVVRTDEPTSGLEDRVRAVLGDAATLVEVVEDCAARRVAVVGDDGDEAAGGAEVPLDELFRDYLAGQGTPGPAADRVLGAFGALLAAAEAEEAAPVPPELSALEALVGDGAEPVERAA